MGNSYSRPTPPLVEVQGLRSKLLVPLGSPLPFYTLLGRSRSPDRPRYPRRHYYDRPPRHPFRGHSPSYSDSITEDTDDFRTRRSRARFRDYDSVIEPSVDDFPVAGEMRGMRSRFKRPVAGGAPRGKRAMRYMGGMADDFYDPDMEGMRAYVSAPVMSPYPYRGMEMGDGVDVAPGAGMAAMPSMTGLQQPGVGAGFASASPQTYPQPAGSQGHPRSSQQHPPVHRNPRPRTAPPLDDEDVILEGAHQAEYPRKRRPPERGGLGDQAAGKGIPPFDYPHEWIEGDPFLDACTCPVGCECRTGRRVNFRKKNHEGRMESGTIRFESVNGDGKLCRNGCTSHGKDKFDDRGAEAECTAARNESKAGFAKLNKKFKRLEEMMNTMAGCSHDMHGISPGPGGRMPGRMASEPMMGGMDPQRRPRMAARMASMPPGMGGSMTGQDPGVGYPDADGFDRFGMDQGMYNPRRTHPRFLDGHGPRQRGGPRRPQGPGRGGRGGRRRRPTFDLEEDDFGPLSDLGGTDDDDAWEDTVDDDFIDDFAPPGRRRASSPGGERRGGGRLRMGRRGRGNRRQARVEDNDEPKL